MDTLSILSKQELPEPSFEFSHQNQANIIISFGPKNGLLWRGEKANPDNFVSSLEKVFEIGFTQGDEQSPLAKLLCVQAYPDFICASNTYGCGDEFFGFDHEQALAGKYGYIYLIDTHRENNIQSIPLCKENLLNVNFVAGYEGEMITEGPDYAVISKIDPKYIIGAIPSAAIASDLGINEKIFISNPVYKKPIHCEKIKEVLGKEFLLIVLERFSSEANQRLQADEMISTQSSSSSMSSNVVSSTPFFPRQTADSISVNNESDPLYQCGK